MSGKQAFDPLNPSMRLMLLSCISECPEARMAGLRELAAGFDPWDSFLRLVQKNRVFPTVFKNLNQLDGLISAQTLRPLQARCARNRLASMALMAELIRILRQFEQEGIRMIALKGPALALELYGDLSLRASKDLDLLVSPRDVGAAEQALMRLGYTPCAPIAALTPRQRHHLQKKGHHFAYTNGAGVEVELHWRYADDHPTEFEDVWAGRKTVTAFGACVSVPGDEENFLFLLHHGSEHGWKRLRWLLDVREIAVKGEIDWACVCRKARERGMTRMLEQTMLLLNLLFGLEMPEGLTGLEIDRPETLSQARRAIALIDSADDLCEYPGHEHYLLFKEYSLRLRRTPRTRLRFLLSEFRPGLVEFQAVRIPDRFFWLYYLVRPVWKLKRLLRREEAMPPVRQTDAPGTRPGGAAREKSDAGREPNGD